VDVRQDEAHVVTIQRSGQATEAAGHQFTQPALPPSTRRLAPVMKAALSDAK
jgi:hypothetical protein